MITTTRSPMEFPVPIRCTPERSPLVGTLQLVRTGRPAARLQSCIRRIRSIRSRIYSRRRKPYRVSLRFLNRPLSRGTSNNLRFRFLLFSSCFTMYFVRSGFYEPFFQACF